MKAARSIVAGAVPILMIGAAFLSIQPVAATTYGGGNVQGYAADAPLQNGTIVQLDSKNTQEVQVATKANLANMFGVTVDQNQLLVSSSNPNLQNEAFVAVSGTYNVLVSTEGGSIAIGDYLTMSSINGVAMKASTDQTTVFGRADTAFDGKGVTVGTSPIKDTSGKTTQTVNLGLIPVDIDIEHNPNVKSTEANLPPALERIGQAIADKEVSPIRIYLSIAIVGASLIIAITILYGGIRNSVVSIGRNPMSKKSIFRAMLQVILTSLLVLIIGLFAVYLLLKL